MDCLRQRVLVRLLPIGFLAWMLAAGCSTLEQQTLIKAPDGQTVAIDPHAEEKAAKRPPKPSTLVALANALRDSPMTGPEKEKMRDQARRYYQWSIELDPKSLEAYTGLAVLYQDQSDYDRAIGVYDRALKVAPKNANVWFSYGMCQARHKDWNAAVANFKTAVQLDPENKQFITTLGACLARAGRYDEALQFFTKELGEAQAHYNVARMYHHVKQYQECKRHLELALKTNPELASTERAAARELLAELERPDGTNKDVVPADGEAEAEARK